MSWLDPRNMFGMPEIKAEGGLVGNNSALDTLTYNTSGRYADRYMQHAEQLERIEYILKRTVTDYDELVKQFKAIKDIERSNRE